MDHHQQVKNEVEDPLFAFSLRKLKAQLHLN
ncbi:MAG: hypothetical protein UZ09_BCD002001305 [Bacteroidetes bacterium OLB9]|nr:MAG: hypothetical protein UZ09_BCD002001305 [Bacteroidetes bacterium OLB9]